MSPIALKIEDRFSRAAPGGSGGIKAVGNYAGSLLPQVPLPPPPRTKWTRSVPHPVLIGHVGTRPRYPCAPARVEHGQPLRASQCSTEQNRSSPALVPCPWSRDARREGTAGARGGARGGVAGGRRGGRAGADGEARADARQEGRVRQRDLP